MQDRKLYYALCMVLLCFSSPIYAQVAKVVEVEYNTLSEAITNANSGETITLIGDVNEDVTVTKNLTIDGDDHKYTGTMTANKGLTVTVKNVHFENAGFTKEKSTTGVYTIKDCTFDGAGRTYGYAITIKGAKTVSVENCTVKDYSYGFMYVSSSLANHSVKNVTIENCNYGVRMASTNTTNLENFVTKDVKYPVQIQANSARTVNMTDCRITEVKAGGASLSCWGGTSNVTFKFNGRNVFDEELPADANFIYKDADEVEQDGVVNNVTIEKFVAKVGEANYMTLAAAVAAAPAGQTITFVTDIAEDVILSKNVTIDGANYKYTGKMTISKANATVQNVNFVKGCVYKKEGTGNTFTVKNSTFDGQGLGSYALDLRGVKVTAENVSVDNYGYGFLQIAKGGSEVSIKNVQIKNVNYAIKLDYASCVTIENVTINNAKYYGIYDSNYAQKTYSINGLTVSGGEGAPIGVWKRNENYRTTFKFTGENDLGTVELKLNGMGDLVLADVDATIKAVEGLEFLKGFESTEKPDVVYEDGVYRAGVARQPAGHVAYRADVTDNTDREGIAILLKEVYAKKSVVVKVYNDETLMFTCTRLPIDDEGKEMFPVDGNTTANIVLWGKKSGSWNNEIHIVPSELNVPNKIEVWADSVLTNSYTNETGTVLGTNLMKYLALDCVKKYAAKIRNVGYDTLDEAIEAAQPNDEVTLLKDVTGAGVVIDKNTVIDFNGFTYTVNKGVGSKGTETLGLQILKENNVTLKNGILKSEGENIKMLVQNYANLTVDNMKLVDATDYIQYVLSNNSGEVVIKNGSEITANGAIALDACKYANYALPTVTVEEGVKVTGDVEVSATLNMYATLNGAIVLNAATGVVNTNNEYAITTNVADHKVVRDENGAYVLVAKNYVAQVDENKYETLAEAIAVGGEVSLLANINEDVTISKNVTIDGAGKTYTGKMTLKADATIKNVNFDGKGYNGYAVETRGANYVTIDNCTAKSYGYGFVQLASGTALTTVKNVTVSDMNYGVKVDYSNAVVLENVDMTANVAAVLNSNYGEKTITIKNSKLNIVGTWSRNDSKNTTYVFEGENTVGEFKTKAAIDNFKLVAGATLTAPNTVTVTTDVEGYSVIYEDGKYFLKGHVAKIGDNGYVTLAEAIEAATAGQTITLLADITEDVTVSKNLTIDGADKTYTGKMTATSNKGTVTIKNVNFDGNGYNGYAVETRGVNYLTIEACTAKNYGYGFVQLVSGTVLTTVKEVTVSDMNYGVKVDYSNAVVVENSNINASVAAILNSNYGEKTITIKNSKLNIVGTWSRNDSKNTTYVFEGENTVGEFKTKAAIDNFKLVAGATLTAPETVTVTTDAVGYMVKYVDGVYQVVGANVKNAETGATYATIAEAIAAAEAGQTITLLSDITEDVTVSKNVTIDGAEHEYTGTMTINNVTTTIQNVAFVKGQVYKHKNTGSTANITIKDCTFDGQGLNAYAVNVGNGKSLTLENVTATNYGYGLLQVPSSFSSISVKNVEVSNVYYGFKVDYTDAVSMENVRIADDVTIGIYDSNYSDNKTYTISNSVLSATTPIAVWERNQTKYTTFKFEGVNTVAALPTSQFAKVVAGGMIGTTVYGSLQDAIDAATEGQTVTIVSDLALTEGVTVAADKNLFIALNGNTITGTPAEAKAYAVITNKGTLTIEGEGAIVCDHTLAGSTSYAVNTIVNSGDLTIAGATIENKSTASNQIGYAIDNNSTSADAVVKIVNGTVTVSGSNYYDGIRQFANSTTAANDVIVRGGKVSSIWMQNPSDGATKNTKDVKGSLTIEGGEVTALYLEPSANFEAAISGGYVGNVSYFETEKGRDLVQFVTGGTFGTEIGEGFLALGYQLYQLTGDAAPYGVKYTGRREAMTIDVAEYNNKYENTQELIVDTLTFKRTLNAGAWNAFFVPFEVPLSALMDNYDVAYLNDASFYDDDENGSIERITVQYVKFTEAQKEDKKLHANHPYRIRPKNADAAKMELKLSNVELQTTDKANRKVLRCGGVYTNIEWHGLYERSYATDFLDGNNENDRCYAENRSGQWQNIGTASVAPFRVMMVMTHSDEMPYTFDEEALANVRAITLGEDEFDTTGIINVGKTDQNTDAIYDMQGRRVLKPVKGTLYIINGKKVVY